MVIKLISYTKRLFRLLKRFGESVMIGKLVYWAHRKTPLLAEYSPSELIFGTPIRSSLGCGLIGRLITMTLSFKKVREGNDRNVN